MDQPAQKGATYAVVGYVSDDVAKSLEREGHGKALELRVERGKDHEVVRIQPGDVAGILHGASQGGETSVQVLLKENAKVETVFRGLAQDLHLRPISDASLVIRRVPINVIFVNPAQISQLTQRG